MSERPIDPGKLSGLYDRTFRVPDLVGAVEGWRVWQVDENPLYGTVPKLHAVTFSEFFWEPRKAARALCRDVPDEHTPGENCSCGFYSAKTLERLRTMPYIGQAMETPGKVAVVGRLANWGKVIEGTQGWRSEFSYPVALYLGFEHMRLRKRLREAYGVPVILMNLLTGTPPKRADGPA